MKSKHLIALLTMILFSLPTLARAQPGFDDWKMTLRMAAYYPTSSKVRDLYSSPLLNYQLEVSWRWCGNVELWGGVDWIMKRGHRHFIIEHFDSSSSSFSSSSSSSEHHKPRIWVLPLSLGAKYVFCLAPWADFYVGAGGCLTFLNLENNSVPFTEKKCRKTGFGGVFKSGVLIELNHYSFLDLFVDYYTQRFHFSGRHREFHRRDLHLDGFKIGVGLGVVF